MQIIDTYFAGPLHPDMVYCLGIVAGAGNVDKTGKLTLNVPARSRHILEFFRDKLVPDEKLSVSLKDNLIVLSLRSDAAVKDLQHLGFHTTGKYFIQMCWPRGVTRHRSEFVRGYFDVCGEIFRVENPQYDLSYIGWKLQGYDEMLNGIRSVIREEVPREISYAGPFKRRGDALPSVVVYGANAEAILQWSHPDA